ncbi:MAG TPA: hypothetical protein ENJ82_15570 [Bacteroidetes bacterium]|nr:hypothetical protein [Bacteroidota bacterium]
MEELIVSRISWLQFLLSASALLGLFFLLRFTVQLLGRISLPWLNLGPSRKALFFVQVLYEPLALLLAATLFFLVRPVSNGLLILLIGMATFSHIRNYFSGRMIALQNNLKVGLRIRVGGKLGRVSRIGRLGIRLQSNDGLHYLDYGQVLSPGYTLVSGEDVAGLYRLRVTTNETENKKLNSEHFMDLLSTSPYLDWNCIPEILNPKESQDMVETRVLLREEDHLQDLVRLIREWGYSCEVVPAV